MANLNRVRVGWTGWPGQPGVSTHFFNAGVTDMAGVKAFYNSLAPLFPPGITFTIPSVGDVINEADGKIVSTWVGTNGGTAVSAHVSNNYPGVAGACIRWTTDKIINGHRLVGRTYLVPLASTEYQSDGTISTATIGSIQSAAGILITAYAGQMAIWSRPFPGKGTPPVGVRAGDHGQVVSGVVPDLAIVMRSRRN